MALSTHDRSEAASDRADMSRRPRFAYLVLTHKEPHQIEALASRILELSPTGEVVVHHDLAADHLPWKGQPPNRVHLVDRQNVLWGDWSMVEATLRMVRFGLEQLEVDWFVLLSGEHWPVVDLCRWEESSVASGTDAFVEASALPRRLHFGRLDEDGNRFLARCINRWVTIAQPSSLNAHRVLYHLAQLALYTRPIVTFEHSDRRRSWFIGIRRWRRGPLKGWTFYKGSQWIAFNRHAADAILHTDPGVTDWFRQGHISDETYFHTVLHHAEGLVVSNRMASWVPPEPERPMYGEAMYIRLDDLPTVWSSGAAFARKVDTVNRPEVIRAIDDEVDRQRATREAARALPVPPTQQG